MPDNPISPIFNYLSRFVQIANPWGGIKKLTSSLKAVVSLPIHLPHTQHTPQTHHTPTTHTPHYTTHDTHYTLHYTTLHYTTHTHSAAASHFGALSIAFMMPHAILFKRKKIRRASCR